MNKSLNILRCMAVTLSAACLFSCEDVIDVDLRSVDPEYVVEGVIRMGEPAEVLITQTKDFSSTNEYTPVTDAVVVISDDAGNSEQLVANAAGKFVATTIVGTEGRTYELSVTCNPEEKFTATSYMPPRVELDSLTLWEFPMVDFPEPMVHFVDPAGEENQYYRFIIGVNGQWPNLRRRLMSTEFMDGVVVHQPIFVRYDDDTDDDPIAQGDEITVEMWCLDKGAYKFFETLDGIDGALANPTSNITGGALGYFNAYSFTRMNITAIW